MASAARQDHASILASLLPRARHEETHLSHVFITPTDVYKLKKPVRLSFVNYSDLAKRKAGCEREIEVNTGAAPGLYLGVVPLTLEDGQASLGGEGEVLDYVVHMRSFGTRDRGDLALDDGRVTQAHLLRFTDRLYKRHQDTEVIRSDGWQDDFETLCTRIARDLSGVLPKEDQELAKSWFLEIEAFIHRDADALNLRGKSGLLTRCHGDLHLKNLCLWQGELEPYDALEFDDAMVRIDPLYDVAFLVADLWHAEHWQEANAVANRYVGLSSEYGAWLVLPAYCSLRAAIRAMAEGSSGQERRARSYLKTALAFLQQPLLPKSVLIAGRSGTGKSTVAARLAAITNPPPGALHIRSDIVRKRLAGLMPEEPLPPDAYTDEARRAVYETCRFEAETVAGKWPVILDMALAGEDLPEASLYDAFDIRIWLDAPEAVLAKRLAQRAGDASDADVRVMTRQRALPPADNFIIIDADADPDTVTARVAEFVLDNPAVGVAESYNPAHEV